jgi:hypothetical protein
MKDPLTVLDQVTGNKPVFEHHFSLEVAPSVTQMIVRLKRPKSLTVSAGKSARICCRL